MSSGRARSTKQPEGPVWALTIERLCEHARGDRIRTYGRYSLAIGGVVQPSISGFTCEAPGPGSNEKEGVDRLRAREGTYPLRFHHSDRYRTADYDPDVETKGVHPLPAVHFVLEHSKARSNLLIHPAHFFEPDYPHEGARSDLFLSSIGCVNPTGPLEPDQDMDYRESRSRVLDILESLSRHVGGLERFAPDQDFPNSVLTIVGEPPAATGKP